MAIPGDMNRPCSVYLVTNTINGKRYIGITTNRRVSYRLVQHFNGAERRIHGGKFHRAIRKYGRPAFKIEVILWCDTVAAALLEEARLVKETGPEYNSTAGGDGRSAPHSEKTREVLRQHAIRDKSGWVKKQLLGVAKSSKAVVCLDTGENYPSASAAACAVGVHNSMIVQVCNRNRATAAGRVFRYFGDHSGGAAESEAVKSSRKRTSEKRPVICLNDNRLFETRVLAASFYGIGTSTVSRSCDDDGRVMQSGLAFNFLDQWCPNPL